MKSVFIIDDHDVFRDGLKLILEEIPGIRVCGECGSGEAFLYEIFTLKPDAVLMDFHLHAHSSISLTKAFNHIQPRPKIILMTMSDEKRYQQDALAVRHILDVGGSLDLGLRPKGDDTLSDTEVVDQYYLADRFNIDLNRD